MGVLLGPRPLVSRAMAGASKALSDDIESVFEYLSLPNCRYPSLR